MEFNILLQWARPKPTVDIHFKTLKGLNQGSMNFEQFTAKVRKVVNNYNIQDVQSEN